MENREQEFNEGRKLEPEVRGECRFPSNLKKSQGRHLTFLFLGHKNGVCAKQMYISRSRVTSADL